MSIAFSGCGLSSVFYSGSALLAMQPLYSYGRVCPSVRLPSHAGIVSRRMKLRSCGFHYQVAKSFYSFWRGKDRREIRRGSPLARENVGDRVM